MRPCHIMSPNADRVHTTLKVGLQRGPVRLRGQCVCRARRGIPVAPLDDASVGKDEVEPPATLLESGFECFCEVVICGRVGLVVEAARCEVTGVIFCVNGVDLPASSRC